MRWTKEGAFLSMEYCVFDHLQDLHVATILVVICMQVLWISPDLRMRIKPVFCAQQNHLCGFASSGEYF